MELQGSTTEYIEPRTKSKKLICINKIFPPVRTGMKYNSLKIDETSLMYVTNYKDSNNILDIINTHLVKDMKYEDTKHLTLADATGGVGGDTITFAKHFKRVISIEKDKERYEHLVNNINVYELDNVSTINDDSTIILQHLTDIDILYIDPPWGGKDYKKRNMIHLEFGAIELETFIISMLEKVSQIRLICLKLPRNYDLRHVHERIVEQGRYTETYFHRLPKMCIIVIHNKKN